MNINGLFIALLVLAVCSLLAALVLISKRNKSLEQKLKRMGKLAFHDELTGVYNSRYFKERVYKENKRVEHARNNHSVQVLFLDLDGFKPVNDTYGHGFGDKVLVQVAECISNMLRPSDVFGRIGGDEFGILFTDSKEEFVQKKGKEIIAALEALNTGYTGIKISASVGVSQSKKGNFLKNPIEAADTAMYVAKKTGKGCVKIYNKSMSKS